MFAHNTVIDASAPADVQPVSGEQDGLAAQVLRLVRSAPLTGMRRAQIVYELRTQMGAAEIHVGTNDLLEFVDETIRREATIKDGPIVDRDGLIAQTSRLERSVPPTGMRRMKILGQFRAHMKSVARQIGPDELLEFVKKALRQDFQQVDH